MVDTGSSTAPPRDADLSPRAAVTRDAIVEAARRLFLDRGYSGVRVSDITAACGISRAGFYTYFRDKRQIFGLLGEATYRDILEVVSLWDTMPAEPTADDVLAWVRAYFAFMDVHGAFIFASTQSPPPDEEFREDSRRMQMRVAWLLGTAVRSRQARPSDAPEAVGVMLGGLLDQAWHRLRFQGLPVDVDDMTTTIAATVRQMLGRDDGSSARRR